MTKPNINVTPLIDVLLVLLIIFMVVSPLKPSDFKTRIPQKPVESLKDIRENPYSLVVTLNRDASLKLNGKIELGTAENAEKLIGELQAVFLERKKNQIYSDEAALNNALSEDEKIEKTVFIKAPKGIDYGSVAKVIDAVKISGANPISLVVDNLDD
ncbi:MAG TPA: biopolymer transporter ExbD [Pyrinomonadaceae bacterium]|nr:biopolymer transporter ExbD [Pyrinomonadaceae bacterium]